jgi:hypothetical protein
MIKVELDEVEAKALVTDVSHPDSCEWSGPNYAFVEDENGNRWLDIEHTIPYKEKICTCGHFKNRQSALDKITAELLQHGIY